MHIYISFASFLACCTAASLADLRVMCVPEAAFFAGVPDAAAAVAPWEMEMRVSSDAKPGMRML